MSRDFRIATLAALAALAASLPVATSAQIRTLAPRGAAIDRTPLLRPDGTAIHILYGTIVRVSDQQLLVRLRNGRLLLIDDSVAIAKGTYSAPLFAGKIVSLEGNFDTHRTFHAARVSRMTRLDQSVAPDH